MTQTIIQLLSGALGSIGFGLLFHLNRRYLPAAGVGGLLAWLAYLLAAPAVHGTFLANLVGGSARPSTPSLWPGGTTPPLPRFSSRRQSPDPRKHPVLLHERSGLQQSAGRGALWRADLFSRIRHCRRHGHCLVPGRPQPQAGCPAHGPQPRKITQKEEHYYGFL